MYKQTSQPCKIRRSSTLSDQCKKTTNCHAKGTELRQTNEKNN